LKDKLTCWNVQESYDRIRDASTFDDDGASQFSVEEYEISKKH
ncbi:5968_t:CDS:1, partial [Dentiscutata erythropus]